MSPIRFQIAEHADAPDAEAAYAESSSTLTVGPSARIPPNMNRLTIDSLTLSFTPAEHQLISLDAYTNSALWKCVSLTAPTPSRVTAVACKEPFDENGIAASTTGPVRYFYSRESQLLRVSLQRADVNVTTYIQCLGSAICGFGPEHELLEIWIQGLRFVP